MIKMNTADMIYEKSKVFPEPIAKEILEFIAYLEYKHQALLNSVTKKSNQKSKLATLIPHQSIVGNPDDLVSLNLTEWHEADNL